MLAVTTQAAIKLVKYAVVLVQIAQLQVGKGGKLAQGIDRTSC